MSQEWIDLAQRSGVPYVDIADTPLNPGILALVSIEIARRCSALPLAVEDGTLTVAMVDPLDKDAVEALAVATGLRIFPIAAASEDINAALDAWQHGAIKWARRRSNGSSKSRRGPASSTNRPRGELA